MKHISFKTLQLALAGCMLAVMASSCISESLDACPKERSLKLIVHGQTGNDITESEAVTDASLFLYDENDMFLEVIRMSLAQITGREEIPLNYPVDKKLKVVAWGNTGGGRQNLNEAEAMEELNITLIKNQNLAETPDILYSGTLECRTLDVDLAQAETIVDEVIIRQRVGQMTIFTKGLNYKLASMGLRSDDEFDFDVQLYNTGSTLDYTGEKVSGDMVDYCPDSALDAVQDEWTTTEREGVLSSENVWVSIEINGEVIVARETTDGEPLYTGVYDPNSFQITFDDEGAFLGIVMVVRPWEYISDEHEF